MKNRYTQLTEFGKNLFNQTSLIDGLPYISLNAKTIIGAERCSIFMYDTHKDELWTTLADGIEKIIIPYDLGIVGQTIKMAKPIIENDPYGNSNFLSDVDMQTGYYTQNLLTSPIFNSKREIIGVIEVLNKKGGFTKQDIEYLTAFTNYVSDFLNVKNI